MWLNNKECNMIFFAKQQTKKSLQFSQIYHQNSVKMGITVHFGTFTPTVAVTISIRVVNSTMFSQPGVLPGKSQNAVLLFYSINFLCAVSKLKPKQLL